MARGLCRAARAIRGTRAAAVDAGGMATTTPIRPVHPENLYYVEYPIHICICIYIDFTYLYKDIYLYSYLAIYEFIYIHIYLFINK